MVIRRGEIWFADLGEPKGSEPGYCRPVLVVQDNHFNDSALLTVIVIGMTSNLKYERYPGNVLIGREESQLPKDSIVNVTSIVTVNKDDLIERVGAVSAMTMDQVDYGLSLVLGMR